MEYVTGRIEKSVSSEVSAACILSSIDCVYSSFSLQTIRELWGTHPGLTAGWGGLKVCIFTIPPSNASFDFCQHNRDKQRLSGAQPLFHASNVKEGIQHFPFPCALCSQRPRARLTQPKFGEKWSVESVVRSLVHSFAPNTDGKNVHGSVFTGLLSRSFKCDTIIMKGEFVWNTRADLIHHCLIRPFYFVISLQWCHIFCFKWNPCPMFLFIHLPCTTGWSVVLRAGHD